MLLFGDSSRCECRSYRNPSGAWRRLILLNGAPIPLDCVTGTVVRSHVVVPGIMLATLLLRQNVHRAWT